MIGTLDTARREATVVGAGIAGLLAAYALDRKGYEVTLLEERERAGGLINTRRTSHGIVETAAHSLLLTPTVADFCRELGVELSEVREESRARYVLRDGKMRKFPLTFGETAGALSRATFSHAGNHADAQTLEDWGRTHLGAAAVDYLLTPFARGIYGVEPANLGVAAAFPELAVAEGGTLLGSLLRKRLSKNVHGTTNDHLSLNGRGAAKGRARNEGRKRMVAPRRGMGDLTARLEKHLEKSLGGRFRRGARVEAIPDAPNVVITVPADAAARLLGSDAPALSRQLLAVRYAPLVTVTAFVPRAAFTRDVRGVGVLVPAREGRKCLGILFNSSAFDGRVTDGARCASFTLLFGGASQPRWVEASDVEIGSAVREELSSILGVGGEPLELIVTRWRRAIPQYSTELPDVWRRARETWCAQSGRILFGNYTGQVSLRGMIETALAVG
jgi:oxygen-dependent protoporphyrinogen oxidase